MGYYHYLIHIRRPLNIAILQKRGKIAVQEVVDAP